MEPIKEVLLKKNEAKMKQDKERNQFTFLICFAEYNRAYIYTHELLVVNKEEEATVFELENGNISVQFCLSCSHFVCLLSGFGCHVLILICLLSG